MLELLKSKREISRREFGQFSISVAAGIVLSSIFFPETARPVSPVSIEDPNEDLDWGICDLFVQDQVELAKLDRRYDVWDIQESGEGWMIKVPLEGEQLVDLLYSGWDITLDEPLTSYTKKRVEEIQRGELEQEGFTNVDQAYELMAEFGNLFPERARVIDIGEGYLKRNNLEGGRGIELIQISNWDTGEDKPVLFVESGIHPRELASQETALLFMEDLILSYDRDPIAAWLLNNREIQIIPFLNPEGYDRITDGSNPYKRKNENKEEGVDCSTSMVTDYGVDNNRNDRETYMDRGTPECLLDNEGRSGNSEPENQAQTEAGDNAFNQRRGTAAKVHSSGREVRRPYLYSLTDVTEHDLELEYFVQKIAQKTGYDSVNNVVPCTGTTLDGTYIRHLVPSALYEIGSREFGFYPPYSHVVDEYTSVKNGLIWQAVIADRPWERILGPEAIESTFEVFEEEGEIVVKARFDQVISGANLYLTLDDQKQENPVRSFTIGGRNVEFRISKDEIEDGRYTISVEGINELNQAGAFAVYPDFYTKVSAEVTLTPQISPTVSPTYSATIPNPTIEPTVTIQVTATPEEQQLHKVYLPRIGR
jgi:hypothetical protein